MHPGRSQIPQEQKVRQALSFDYPILETNMYSVGHCRQHSVVDAHSNELGQEDLPERKGVKTRAQARSESPSRVDPSVVVKLLTAHRRRKSQDLRLKVQSFIKQLFSSADTLILSFSTASHKIDMDSVCSFYNAVMSINESSVTSDLVRRIRFLLHKTNFNRGRSTITSALVIIILCPAFRDPQFHSGMIEALYSICCLRKLNKISLLGQLRNLSAVQFSELLKTLQNFLTTTVFHGTRSEAREAEVAAKVMEMLFEISQTDNVTTHEDFYNNAVNSPDFDLELDFKMWQKKNTFSFCNFPFLYDSGSKSQILQLKYSEQQDEAIEGALWRAMYLNREPSEEFCPYLFIRVRRGNLLLQDTIDYIQAARERNLLKCPLKVHFAGEDGIDEGGLAKEFFSLVFKQLFDLDYGMFTYDEESHYWWFRSSTAIHLDREFELAGTLLGLALYNNHTLDLHFPLVVYKKLLGYELDLEDLGDISPDIHRSLKHLENLDHGVSSLGLHFVVDHDTGLGEVKSFDLVPNGSSVKVTNRNRLEFIRLYTKFLLDTSIKSQFESFKKGFLDICSSKSLQMFLPEELEHAICGKREIDLQSLESHTQYAEGYSRSTRVIKWFWEFVHGLDENRKKKLLSFVTGSDRVPIRGFADLSPCFTIVREGTDSTRLPTAHTCFNLLHLPDYPSQKILRKQMETAIDNSEGFGLM